MEEISGGDEEKIEEKLEDIDGIDKIYSTTIEGLSTVRIELKRNVNIDRVVNDVKNAVDTIDDFPLNPFGSFIHWDRECNLFRYIAHKMFRDIVRIDYSNFCEGKTALYEISKLTNIS
jgi:hypothetical protein